MQLGLLFFFFFVATFVFASVVFAIEKNEEFTSFQNMYDAIWWAIITMTTVRLWHIVHPCLLFVLRWAMETYLQWQVWGKWSEACARYLESSSSASPFLSSPSTLPTSTCCRRGSQTTSWQSEGFFLGTCNKRVMWCILGGKVEKQKGRGFPGRKEHKAEGVKTWRREIYSKSKMSKNVLKSLCITVS